MRNPYILPRNVLDVRQWAYNFHHASYPARVERPKLPGEERELRENLVAEARRTLRQRQLPSALATPP